MPRKPTVPAYASKPPSLHESMSYLQMSFTAKSDVGDSQSIRRLRPKRYLDVDV
ncbi:hypothetical protein ANO14919_113630 [Xylariales sp. No.14919]|nr:hypothetical protein ANO14919_113630 [Xylariales sp. No.14919]